MASEIVFHLKAASTCASSKTKILKTVSVVYFDFSANETFSHIIIHLSARATAYSFITSSDREFHCIRMS